MKFLVDAQFPQRFCEWLQQAGHDARHTIHLPGGNRTTDQALVDIADREGRVVITKDSDFSPIPADNGAATASIARLYRQHE